MSKSSRPSFKRAFHANWATRLKKSRCFVQVVAGPHQVGKTTLMLQALQGLGEIQLGSG
jgi:predicted AAA+ superfamily ATPase